MKPPIPAVLVGYGVRLEPLGNSHKEGLAAAARDGRLWELWYTSVPHPDEIREYIAAAEAARDAGRMLVWAVCESSTGKVLGSTRFHDIAAEADRVEIGYTWYAASVQRTHVNTSCKLLLMTYAFEELGCAVVGLRTDNFNFASQRAIEALGAKKDGVIRRHQARRDGSLRDTVMYSVLSEEWRAVKRHLELRLQRHAGPYSSSSSS